MIIIYTTGLSWKQMLESNRLISFLCTNCIGALQTQIILKVLNIVIRSVYRVRKTNSNDNPVMDTKYCCLITQ